MFALLVGAGAAAQERTGDKLGGALAPAMMPPGSSSLYGFVGTPEVGLGYRQGIGGMEFEGRADFNMLLVSGGIDGLIRYPLFWLGPVQLAPLAGIGLELNSGSKYFEYANFQYLGLRPRLGAVAVTSFSETVRGICMLDLPWTFPLRPQGGTHFSPRLSAGVELHLGERLTGFVQAGAGPEWLQEPLGAAQLRLGLQLKMGLGMRLF